MHAYSLLRARTGRDGSPEFALLNPSSRIAFAKPNAPLLDRTDDRFWMRVSDMAGHFETLSAAKVS